MTACGSGGYNVVMTRKDMRIKNIISGSLVILGMLTSMALSMYAFLTRAIESVETLIVYFAMLGVIFGTGVPLAARMICNGLGIDE